MRPPQPRPKGVSQEQQAIIDLIFARSPYWDELGTHYLIEVLRPDQWNTMVIIRPQVDSNLADPESELEALRDAIVSEGIARGMPEGYPLPDYQVTTDWQGDALIVKMGVA